MLLDRINEPADLRTLDGDQLATLAAEIRTFIVHAVSETGGHLGSNLGAVELTLALHRVFDSPKDTLLWDTGHQAYVHKIVTGRRESFADLRQENGLSGYPSRAESPHDRVENSHASTILSYAYGFAAAQDLGTYDADSKIVAVIGDGSLTGGLAYEALNNLGHSGRNVVIVLNDNGRSYAPTVSRLTESVAKMRMSQSYLRQRARVERIISTLPMGEQIERGFEATRAALREAFEPPHFFETLGVRYTGPIDGHDIADLEWAFRQAAAYNGPVVVHVLTQKGKGYKPAEEDDEKHWHDAPLFDPEVGPRSNANTKSYTHAFTTSLIEAAEANPDVVAITAAMPGSTGLIPFAERFPDRFFDVGIAEQHAVCGAAGMAMAGLRPVVAVYSTFLCRAFDQLVYDVGLHAQPVIFCIDRAGVTGPDGASHHGWLDMALFSKVPGITMFAPSSYQELQTMFATAMELRDGPVALRWPRTSAPMVDPDQVGSGLSANKLRSGNDVAILAVGKMVAAALEAADLLEGQGVSTTVWDPRVVAPLDPLMIADLARHPFVITAEDGVADGGIGSIAAQRIAEAAIDEGQPVPAVRVLGLPTRYLHQATAESILARLGLDGPGIAAATIRLTSSEPITPR